MSKVIGVDLGSTFSAVAVLEGGKPVVIANEEGSRTTPSVISLKDGDRKVGASAKRQIVVNPKETVNLIKRFMGATYSECEEPMRHVQYDVNDRGGVPRVSIEGRDYSPEELSSMIIQKLKKTAEDYLGEEVKDCCITVPAFFGDAARAATKLAGELAGLNVLRVIAEPTAALLASNIDLKKDGKYLVVDTGGATQDNSVADVSDGVVEILATNGDVFLGGSDFDREVAEFVMDSFEKENNIDLHSDAQAVSRIYEAAESAKIELSSSMSAEISLPYITMKDGAPIHLTQTITRAKFEQLIGRYVDRIIDLASEALREANVEAKDLNGILLVGGSCRIPLIQQRLTEAFGVELIKSANLDLAVAEGAAVQGGMLNGEGTNDILLVDVCPLAYGVETLGGVMTNIIEANSTIPYKHKETFTTSVDNQTNIEVRVLQGNRPMAKDNKEVGRFVLDGIMPAKRGVPKIEISFDIDANSILKVSAVDLATKKEQNITIESNGGLSKEEIERMKADAEKFAEQDKKERDTADAINKGDAIIISQERMLEDAKDSLSEEDKKKIGDLLEKMKKAVDEKNISEINSIEQEINSVWNEISKTMYENAQKQKAEEASDNSEAKSEDVQDADFEEVN